MKHRVFKMSKVLMFIMALCIILPGAALAVNLPETGQTYCYGYKTTGALWAPVACTTPGATEDDAAKLAGASWPSPRWACFNSSGGSVACTDASRAKMTDNLVGPTSTTNLQWMANANCMQTNYPGVDTVTGTVDTTGDGGVQWQTALNFVAGINSGTYPNCQFGHTDWRLPNLKELASIIGYNDYNTVNIDGTNSAERYHNARRLLQDAGFFNIRYVDADGYGPYWTGNTRTEIPSNAWHVDLDEGLIYYSNKTTASTVPTGANTLFPAVLPVRTAASCTPTTEVCDGVDNDCDGQIDEGVMTTFYQDNDSDTYGNSAVTIEACTAPSGYVAVGGDCADNDSTRYPGAPDIICNGVDNDCDSFIDEDYVSTPTSCGIGACASTGNTTCVGGVEGDTCTPGIPGTEGPYGDPTCIDSSDNDCDGNTDTADIDCQFICTPTTEVCDGVDNDCDSLIDEDYVPVACDGADSDLCADDMTSCVSGAVVCSVGDDDAEITNNGIDDDCNPATPTASVSGSGYNMPTPLFRASLNVSTTVKYYNTRNRLNLSSSSFTVSASGGTGTVTGTATVNGAAGCTFTVTVTDGSPDAFGIVVAPGGACTAAYTAGVSNILGGNGFVVVGQ